MLAYEKEVTVMKKSKINTSYLLKPEMVTNSDAQHPTTIKATHQNRSSTMTVQPQYGGVLRIADTWSFPTNMGVPGRQNVGAPSLEPIVEHFFRVDREGKLITHLIEFWEYSEDGLHLTLHLRKGIKFHDGTEFDAEAAKWNLIKGREFKGTLKGILSIDAIDKYTILLNMKNYDNIFLSQLAVSSGFVHSPTAYKTYGEEYCAVHPVGTGPFKFVSYKPDVSIISQRFDDYWQKGKPYLDKIEMLYVKDIKTGVDMLRSGEADVAVNINGRSATSLLSEGYIISKLPGIMEALLPDSLNSDSPLTDKRVRQAMEYAIDRPAIVKALGYGYFALTQLATEAVYGYNPEIEGRPYNTYKAKKLLKEAGYPDGFKTKLIGGDATELPAIFAAIKANLADVGIEAEIEIADAALWKDYRANRPWHNASLLGHYPIDPNFLFTFLDFHTKREYGQTSVLRNFDDIINAALQARDYDTLVKNTQRIVKHLFDEAIVIPITVDPAIAAASTKVHDVGYFEAHLRIWTPWNAWIEH